MTPFDYQLAVVGTWLILAVIAWMTKPKKNHRRGWGGSFTRARSSRRRI